MLIMAAGALVYSNSFRGSFVFDDINFITKNDPDVHMTVFSWEAIKKAALEGNPRHRYLPNISFAVNYFFGGENTFGYHLVNLGIHLLTGIFLFFLFNSTLWLCSREKNGGCAPTPSIAGLRVSPETLSFFAVMLWLVHPVQTNAVTYVCQRMASMVAMFYILSLLCYVRGRVSTRNKNIKKAVSLFAGCLFFGVCAVASKQNAGTLPVFILVYEWFFFQDLKFFRSFRTVILIIAGGIVFALVAIHFLGADPLHRILDAYTRREFTLPQRVMTEFRVVVYYLSLLVYPHPDRLILDHDYPLSYGFFNPATTLTCCAAIAGLACMAAYPAKRDRLVSFSFLWFLGTLAIESSVIGIEIIYEHRMYLPTMFLFLAMTMAVFRISNRQWTSLGALLLCVMILSAWAHQRNRIWESDVAFWTDNAKKSPQKERPYQNLAYSFQMRQDYKNALFYYRKSLGIKRHPVVYYNMGLCLDGIGYYSDAADAYVNALKMGYNTAQVHASLANTLTRIGEFDAAVSHFNQSKKLSPADSYLEKKLQALKAFLAKCREPEQCVLISMAQEPDNPALQYKLAMIYEKQGKADQAYAIYETILKKIGGADRKLYLLVLRRMAAFQSAKKDVEESIRILHQGIAAAPENPFFYYEIGAYYGMKGEIKKSVTWLDLAIQKGYQDWGQIKTDPRLEGIRHTQYVQNLMATHLPGRR